MLPSSARGEESVAAGWPFPEGRAHLKGGSERVVRSTHGYFTKLCSGSLYLKLIDSCITQLKARGPSANCNESKEAEDTGAADVSRRLCVFKFIISCLVIDRASHH